MALALLDDGTYIDMQNDGEVLILPGNPAFNQTLNNSAVFLHTLSSIQGKSCVGVREGIPVAMTEREMLEYLLGGESDLESSSLIASP
jgi:hypothetical protein